jgi:hypothetical protein
LADFAGGIYTITTSSAPSLGPAANQTILLQATLAGSGRVNWQCGPGSIEPKYLPGSCRAVITP